MRRARTIRIRLAALTALATLLAAAPASRADDLVPLADLARPYASPNDYPRDLFLQIFKRCSAANKAMSYMARIAQKPSQADELEEWADLFSETAANTAKNPAPPETVAAVAQEVEQLSFRYVGEMKAHDSGDRTWSDIDFCDTLLQRARQAR